MATFRYSHIYSETSGFTPSSDQLEKAEIGLQLAAGDEGLFFKNAAGTVVKVGIGVSYTKEETDGMYVATAAYETSGSTPEIVFKSASGNTLATIDATPFIKDGMIDEVVITAGTGANDGKQVLKITWNNNSGKNPTSTEIPLEKIFNPANYYTKDEINAYSGTVNTSLTTLTTQLSTLNDTLSAHTANTSIHVGTGEREAWNEVSAKTDTTAFTAHSGNTELHVTKAKQDAWDAKAEVSDVTAVDNKVTAHTSNNDIHVTTDDKTKWNAVENKIDTTAVTATYIAKAEYSSTDKKIYFYNGNNAALTASTIDASDFIKDGMVEEVVITAGTGANDGKQVLKITWNDDSDKSTATEIPLDKIFNAENYYTKTDINNYSGTVNTTLTTLTTNLNTVSGDVEDLQDAIITAATAAYDGTSNVLSATLTKGDNSAFTIDMLIKKDASGIILNKDAGNKIVLSGGTF